MKAKEEVIRVKGTTPYPSFEGEKGKAKKAKEEVIRAKGRELNADLKIDTIDNPTLPRILLWYQREHSASSACKATGNSGWRNSRANWSPPESANAKHSVCDILNFMHDMSDTLGDIGISASTAQAARAAKLAAWKVMLQD